MKLVDPSIYDKNTCTCSDHFEETSHVSSVLAGFGPSKWTLKADAVPTIFSFNSPPKRRKLSEARQAKAQHRDLVEGLLEASCSATSSATVEPVREVTTRDIGTQTGKLNIFLLFCILLKLNCRFPCVN